MPTIPDHELIRCIGAGSYGEVWLVRNVLGQLRAVKIVHRSTFEDDRPFEREFEGIRRFEPISRSHPSQLNILHVGRGEECFYYVMELADSVISNPCSVISNSLAASQREAAHPHGILHAGGGARAASAEHAVEPLCGADKLTSGLSPSGQVASPAGLPNTDSAITEYSPRTLKHDLKQRGRLPPAECVEIALALTTALAHLHAHGLVHRDIKPSNIIFVGGVPKLADIGLVTDVDASRSFVGTEGFIPPEGPGTPQADLYSLGIVLYQMSTGKSHQAFPEPLEDLASQPDHAQWLEFNAVIHKACAANVRERYQAAEEMQAELALLQRGESVKRRRAARGRLKLLRKLSVLTAAVGLFGVMIWLLLNSDLLSRWTAGKTTQGLTAADHRLINERGTLNREAYELYAKGRTYENKMTREGFSQAVYYFNQSLRADPSNAHAYIRLSYLYRSHSGWYLPPKHAMEEAKRNAVKAVEANDRLFGAHLALGYVKLCYDWDWRGASNAFQRGLELAPANEAIVHRDYAQFLLTTGQWDKALQEERKALEIAPDNKFVNSTAAWDLFLHRDYASAIARAQRLLSLSSNDMGARLVLGRVHTALGNYALAAEALQAVRNHFEDAPDLMSYRGYLYAVAGQKANALNVLRELEQASSKGAFVSQYWHAYIYAGLGYREEALKCLWLAYDERFNIWPEILNVAAWDAYRTEPPFVALLGKVGLGR